MKTKPKTSYRIRNWQEYDGALKQRGSITFWVSEQVIQQWRNEQKTGRKGASNYYSDLAITTMGTLKSVFRLASRQTEGFLESLFTLMGIDLAVPDHTTLSRRLGKLTVELPVVPKAKGVHVVVDSTGVKVYGDGEWKVRQREAELEKIVEPYSVGWLYVTRYLVGLTVPLFFCRHIPNKASKRRTWRKLHLGVDEASGEILAPVVSTNNISDSEVLPQLLDAIPEEIEQVSADGAYDTASCYDAIDQRRATAAIPPRRNARIWQHGDRKAPPHPRDENLRQIRKIGRTKWKRQSNYHRRSLAETTMFRVAPIFGGKLLSRSFDNQVVELFLQCAALNRIIGVGKPDSYLVES